MAGYFLVGKVAFGMGPLDFHECRIYEDGKQKHLSTI